MWCMRVHLRSAELVIPCSVKGVLTPFPGPRSSLDGGCSPRALACDYRVLACKHLVDSAAHATRRLHRGRLSSTISLGRCLRSVNPFGSGPAWSVAALHGMIHTLSRHGVCTWAARAHESQPSAAAEIVALRPMVAPVPAPVVGTAMVLPSRHRRLPSAREEGKGKGKEKPKRETVGTCVGCAFARFFLVRTPCCACRLPKAAQQRPLHTQPCPRVSFPPSPRLSTRSPPIRPGTTRRSRLSMPCSAKCACGQLQGARVGDIGARFSTPEVVSLSWRAGAGSSPCGPHRVALRSCGPAAFSSPPATRLDLLRRRGRRFPEARPRQSATMQIGAAPLVVSPPAPVPQGASG